MSEVNHSDRGHSVVGASSADRWMNCPGSNKLIEQAPPQAESSYASEGTCAHELAEHALNNSGKCIDYVGMSWEGHTVTEEMAEYVQIYVDYVMKAAQGTNKDLIIEESFELDFIREGMFGSNDAVILEFMGGIEVIDLKYGKGKEVFAEDNRQLKYYAVGAAHGGDYTYVKLTIIQPRVQNPIKSSTITMKELESYGEELGVAVDLTRSDKAHLEVGDHCFFCPAKAICPEKRKRAQEIIKMDFKVEEERTIEQFPKADLMDEKTLKNVLNHADMIKKWLDSVSAYAKHQLEKGVVVPGFKLVKGRSNRKVQSEVELHMAFGDEIYSKKLKGIGDLEKAFGKKEVAEFLFKPEGKLTMAPWNDKREEVQMDGPLSGFTIEAKPDNKADNFDNFNF